MAAEVYPIFNGNRLKSNELDGRENLFKLNLVASLFLFSDLDESFFSSMIHLQVRYQLSDQIAI